MYLAPWVICIYNLCELYPTILHMRKEYHFFTFFKLNPSLSLFPPAVVEKFDFYHYWDW